MQPLSFGQRFRLFLYSGNNIAGCVLGFGGLGLFFGGVIHAYWWAIVAGLYGAGALGWPRSELAQAAEHAELSNEMMAEQMQKLLDNVAKGLSAEALAVLRSIQSTLGELLPRLQQLQDRGVISAKDAFTVLETVRRYLPDTLAAYLRLPKLYARTQILSEGRTASQILLEQLKVLDMSLKDVAHSAFTGDAEKLMTNGRFLQTRFAERVAFLP